MKYLNIKNPSAEDNKFKEIIEKLPDTVGEYISDFEFRDGLLEIYRVAKIGNKYFNDQEPWKAVKEDMQKQPTVYIYQIN